MKEQMKSAAVMRAGFTMMEIMVAVMIIGILAVVGVKNVMKNVETARLSAAADGVKTLKEAVVSYNMKYGKMPNDLKDLLKETDDEDPILEGGEDALLDPWGRPYTIEWKGSKKKRFAIVSSGPDANDKDDDIRSDKVKSQVARDSAQ